ncbi:MAG TPA: 3-deoxy-D-manno-octulosonic acid transferase, partial [Nitratifractor sp.]|nr:3-deoxy-D-manno-octulosonic acid transferase [Nitratifractor sp.]
FSVIKEYSKSIRYLPFEIFLPSWIKRQKALIVVEAELWYMLFLCSKKRGAKTFLINARVSSRSYPKYLRFKWLYKHIFANIDAVYAQSYDDAKRLVQLGAKNIHVSGNIKFLNIQKANKEYSKEYPVVVAAASTHETEEEPIVNAYLELKRVENAQLIVIPRHPERFDKVAEYLERVADKNRLSFSRFSQSGNFATDIVLVDTMGELINVYKISDIVILGGAFAEIGGHNALEAAQFGVKMISGPHYFNQVDIFNAIEGLEICESNALGEKLLNYRSLPNTKLETKASIDELVEDIRSVL